jgi:O-antigen/teichoic acid export membrane protein
VPTSDSFLSKNLQLFIAQIFVYISGFIAISFIVKTFGTQALGTYSIIISLLGVLAGISSLGTGFTAKRFLPSEDCIKTRSGIFYPQFFFNIISAIFIGFFVVYFFFIIERYLLKGIGQFNEWILFFYLLFYVLYSQVTDIFRYTHSVPLYGIFTTAYPYIFLITLLLWHQYDNISINELIFSHVIALGLILIFAIPISIRKVGFTFSWYKKSNFFKDIKFGFPLIAVVIFELIISISDRYVIAAYLDLEHVAFYTVAYSVASIPLIFPKVIGVVLPPIISRLKDNNKENEIGAMINMSIFYYLMFIIPFLVGVVILGKPLLSLYSNDEVASAAAGLMPIITLSILFYGVGSILSNILFVDMKTKKILLSNAAAGLLNLIANIVIFSIINDIYVAAWTTFFSYALYLILIYRFIDKEYKINLFGAKIIMIVVSSVIMSVALYLMSTLNFNFYTVEGLVSGIVVGCIVYFAFLFLTKVITYKELIYFVNR